MTERGQGDGVLLARAAIEVMLESRSGARETCDGIEAIYARIGRRFSVEMAEALTRSLEAELHGTDADTKAFVEDWAARQASAGTPTPLWVRARLLGRRPGAAEAWDAALAAAPRVVPEGLVNRARARLGAGDGAGAAADLRLALAQPGGYDMWTRAEKVARRLRDRSDVPYARSLRLALVGGTASLSLLSPLLRLACLRDGIDLELHEGDYDAWQQEILHPESGLRAFAPDVTLLMTHWRDAGLPAYSNEPDEVVEAAAGRITGLWQSLRAAAGCTVLAQTFDLPTEDPYGRLGTALPGGRGAMLRALNERLRGAAGDGIVLLDLERVAGEVGTTTWAQPRAWFSARQHPGPGALVPLVEAQVAHLRAILGLTRKVVVLDLDNTLWGGVIGEDGLAGIQLGPPSAYGEAFQAFHHYLKALRERGVLLAVCSKNNPADAREPFERHPETVLRLDDFVMFVANWQDKATNLREIAATLSLGLDSFVFVDDNPVERAWVREQMPEVAIPELPEDPAGYVAAIERCRFFEAVALSDEDRARHASYRAEVERRELESGAGSLDEFLVQLGMKARHGKFDATNLPRIAQLVNKTNQFNLTTRRYNEAQLRDQSEKPGWWTHWFRLADRFNDAGLIGVMTCRPREGEERAWEIDNWLMSCRVLGRRMEEFMLGVAVGEARNRGLELLYGCYVPTAKNQQVADLFERLGFSLHTDDGGGATTWVLELSEAALCDVPIVDERASD